MKNLKKDLNSFEYKTNININMNLCHKTVIAVKPCSMTKIKIKNKTKKNMKALVIPHTVMHW